ncbi:GNAT family N-acetyltransferase [Arthrobacter zhaoguopingii]|uniref:GNAT family N-acetyltransferase n=1 Tax=Arthrobacter zhaoguopingii TaxID=2681491 RepID=UPI001FE97DFF|nr:GNAT family N-acetyltransferase [Arthrobacter zhaoguopingii]
MSKGIEVRAARVEDVQAMAQVHVESWQETYRGLVPDAVLDDPGFTAARERQWLNALTNPRWTTHRIAVAEHDGPLIGLAMAGPSEDDPGLMHLYVLYLLAEHHGSGTGAELLRAVIEPDRVTTLWVAERNPRAQVFYRKHGFELDGGSKIEGEVLDLRMVRHPGPLCRT